MPNLQYGASDEMMVEEEVEEEVEVVGEVGMT
jgi:hypothetical protein